MRVKIFDDYAQFLTFVENVPIAKRIDYASEWSGGSYNDALHLANQGDADIARKSQKIIMDIENVLLPSIESYEIVSHYYGARPNIGAVIAGSPKSMYKRNTITTPSQQGLVKIYFDRFSSAGYSAEQIIARGTAILALVLALKRVRPIVLYTGEAVRTWSIGKVIWATAIDINNIDYAVLANALAGASFYRSLGFTVNSFANGDHSGGKLNTANIKKLLGWSNSDIVFEGMALSDDDTKLSINNPTQWAKQRFEQLCTNYSSDD